MQDLAQEGDRRGFVAGRVRSVDGQILGQVEGGLAVGLCRRQQRSGKDEAAEDDDGQAEAREMAGGRMKAAEILAGNVTVQHRVEL